MPVGALAAATVVSAGVGYASSKSAAKTAANAESTAAATNAALARETRDKITGLVQPFVEPAYAANNALAVRAGLRPATGGNTLPTGGGNVVPFPGSAGASSANPLAGAAAGGTDKAAIAAARGPIIGYGPTDQPIYANSPTGAANDTGAVTGGTPNFAAYGASNPDLQAEWQRIQDTGNASAFGNDPNNYYAWHWQTYGQNEVGTPGTVRVAPPMTGGTSTAPTGNGLYDIAGATGASGGVYGLPDGSPAAPDPGARPTMTRQDVGAAPSYDFSMGGFYTSPDYLFRQKEASRELNANYGARGVLGSGGAIKAILDRASNLAAGEYGSWFQRQLARQSADRAQFNTDAARTDANYAYDTGRSDSNYNGDRTFNYGKWFDDRNFNVGRFDQQTNDLYKIANTGLSGIGTIAGANTNALGTIANSNTAAANATGSAAIAGANALTGAINGGTQALGLYYGLKNPAATSSIGKASTSNLAWMGG